MKKLFLLFICVTITGIAQNSVNKSSFEEKIIQFKKQDDLEEYVYTFFDEYLKTKDVNFLNKGINSIWRNPKNNNEKTALLHLKINIGYYYFNKGAIAKSNKFYENALLYYQKNDIKNYKIITYCLKPLANNYTRLGDYQRAEELYKYTLEIALKQHDQKALIGTYLNLAILLQSTDKNNEAITLLKKSLTIKDLSLKQKNEIQIAIAKNYSLIKNYQKALEIVNALKPNYQTEIIKSGCYYNKTKLKLAKNHITKAIDLLKQTHYSKRELAKTYNLLAKIQIKENDLQNALATFNQSLKILTNNDNLYAENTFLEIFDGKASIYELQNNFEKAINNYNKAIKIAALLQITKSSQFSKIIQQLENRTRSEKIVNLYYQLYQKNTKTVYIEKAFKNVELSKSMVLLEKLKYQYAKNNKTNDSLFQKELTLEKEKAILSKKIKLEELKGNNAKVNLIKTLTSQRAKINTKLAVLKQKIQAKYPFTNYNLESISVKTLQEQFLLNKQQFIEFFDTINYIYVFSITQNQAIQWQRVEKDENYNLALKTFIDLFISNNGSEIKNDVSIYQKSAFTLYQKLLKNSLSKNHPKITIIPDGKLNFLAFDALLTDNKPYISFKKLSYLIFQKEINYGYSANILFTQNNKPTTNTNKTTIIGFFPYFENNYRKLQELTYTLDEKKAISSFKNNFVLEKENATKKQFLNLAPNYNIIHLSTHASAGNFEKPAHIEFRNKTLYLPEIYGLSLNTNLLVLSACETGIGKLQKGEGTMSLARGFSYAGIKNLLVSQWKVNDKSTSILMRDFYNSFKKSKNISASLHQAKLNYLKNNNISNLKKTPYYWAGFEFIGNTNQLTSNSNIILVVSLFIFAIIGVFLFFQKKIR